MDLNNNDQDPAKEWKELSEDDLIRGETPADIEELCLKHCRAYIGGIWLEAKTPADIVVTRIKGGLTNQLYKIELGQAIVGRFSVNEGNEDVEDDEPRAVAIKFFQPKHFMFIDNQVHDALERLPDTIILTLASHAKISPRVYGIFPEGFIQRYYEHEQFVIKHQQNPALVTEVMAILARIHHLKVPLIKDKSPQLDACRVKLNSVFATTDIEVMARVNGLNLFLDNDIREEFERLLTIIKAVDSPIVFSHNDFRGSNILVTAPDNQILVCDLEYSRYGPRAVDIISLVVEWNRELFDFFSIDALPSDEIIKTFVQAYVNKMDELDAGYAKRPENDINQMVREVKTYALLYQMSGIAWLLEMKVSIIEKIKFDKIRDLKICHVIYGNYLKLKAILIADGTIRA